jgi:hypothetical protein
VTPEQIHDIAVTEFGLQPRPRSDGKSYWTMETAATKATRVLRVSPNANGGVREIKLVVSSLASHQDVFLSAPFTLERVREAIAHELRGGRE